MRAQKFSSAYLNQRGKISALWRACNLIGFFYHLEIYFIEIYVYKDININIRIHIHYIEALSVHSIDPFDNISSKPNQFYSNSELFMPIFTNGWVTVPRVCRKKTLEVRPLSRPNSGFLLLINKAECRGGGAMDARSEVGIPVDPASVVAGVFGQAMSDPTRGKGEHTINPLPPGWDRHQNTPMTRPPA